VSQRPSDAEILAMLAGKPNCEGVKSDYMDYLKQHKDVWDLREPVSAQVFPVFSILAFHVVFWPPWKRHHPVNPLVPSPLRAHLQPTNTQEADTRCKNFAKTQTFLTSFKLQRPNAPYTVGVAVGICAGLTLCAPCVRSSMIDHACTLQMDLNRFSDWSLEQKQVSGPGN
jgi:hypothetical protein